MNEKSLKRGVELDKEMQVIKRALASIKLATGEREKAEEYWLCVSAHKDGSGQFCDLIGANVANDVLDAIYAELQNQLAKREEEFSAL